ncbi:MAG TPA: formate transporter FocA [Tessaracoccus flavescens]|uniref:Formate transporter FocA n=1 Tax=Tessaracoccus flavescens TaxID=399497 RepID=A0A921EPW3_9ACTN|nr:formate transporter FocA [Tessaracoccus flavescens]
MDDLAAKLTIVAPPGIAAVTEQAMIGKARKGRFEMFLLALTGGAFIGLGFIFFTTSQMGAASNDWYGLTKVVGGLCFSVGLVLVVLTGADLFTSTTMSVIPLIRKKINPGEWISHWLIVYLGNIIGAVGLAFLVFMGGTYMQGHGAWGVAAINSAFAKVSHTWLEAFALGILANLAVCLAIWTSNAGRSLTDKLLAITGPIALFVASGFEHSVANMFMIPMGLIVKNFGGQEFWGSEAVAAAGLTPEAVSHLTVSSFFLDNLIPVTLGNIVGGSILVGVYYWACYLRPHDRAERTQPVR